MRAASHPLGLAQTHVGVKVRHPGVVCGPLGFFLDILLQQTFFGDLLDISWIFSSTISIDDGSMRQMREEGW